MRFRLGGVQYAMGISLAMASACANQIEITERNPQLVVAAPVTDLDTHAVNTEFAFSVSVSAAEADAQILTIDVLNIDGTYFEVVDESDGDDSPFVIPKDETAEIALVYAPQQEGYHRAVVTLAYAGVSETVSFEVRGRAVTPEAQVWPWAIDFGAVEAGEVVGDVVTVTNSSELELIISDAAFSSPEFATSTKFPLEVGPQTAVDVVVEYVPISGEAVDETMILSVGSVLLPTVSLRGNDCENGSPAAYDLDGDGFTSCGGDCDDLAEGVYPGHEEVEDGVDEDCDGLIDEGTLGYDDDGDGFCDHPEDWKKGCSDGVSVPGDCNDGDPAVNPGLDEVFGNGIDDDCNGVVDYGTTDDDNDGYSVDGGDCDDADNDVYPDAPEQADGKDNDCDGLFDEGTIKYDDDGDGYCEHPVDCTDLTLPGDCNDDVLEGGADAYPGAIELADWRDNDCDSLVDEGTDYFDDDYDGFTEFGGDCDDDDPMINPAMLEVPGNGIDEDCIDEPATD